MHISYIFLAAADLFIKVQYDKHNWIMTYTKKCWRGDVKMEDFQ